MSYYFSNEERCFFYFSSRGLASHSEFMEELSRCSSSKLSYDEIISYTYKKFESEKKTNSYREDMDGFIDVVNAHKHGFLVSFGDGPVDTHLPVFVKSRRIGDGMRRGIILKLNSGRHWDLSFLKSYDMEWHKKKSRLFWRGAPTGIARHRQRLTLVERYSDVFDVGFSGGGKNSDGLVECYVKGSVPKEEQLKYKFILSVEGNDVATNLKWILASSSIPIMPKPTRETWLLESKLLPYVHYVPVNDNFDNLEEVYEWCMNNDDHCRQIAKNGMRYMEMFLDKRNEENVFKLIYERYVNLF